MHSISTYIKGHQKLITCPTLRRVHRRNPQIASRPLHTYVVTRLRRPPTMALSDYVSRIVKWAAIRAIAVIYAVPVALNLLWGAILHPRRTFAYTDWESRQFPSPVQNVAHEMLEVGDGIIIHAVRTGGAPEKPIMLLVHGFPEYWGSWRHQMETFRKEYDVVAIDMRGYGLSSKPKGVSNYTVSKLADDIAGVVKALGVDKVVLVAHDWGATVCWGAVYLHPHLFSKFISACGPHPKCFLKNMDWDQFKRSWYMFVIQLPLLPELVLSANDFACVDNVLLTGAIALRTPGALSHQDVDAYKRELARPGALTAALNYYRAMMASISSPPDPRVSAALGRKLAVPTLVVWASHDTALGPQLLRGMGKYVDNLKVHTVEGSSHWVQQDKPWEFNRAVAEFLSGEAGGGRAGLVAASSLKGSV